jgi:hypothetical protein
MLKIVTNVLPMVMYALLLREKTGRFEAIEMHSSMSK